MAKPVEFVDVAGVVAEVVDDGAEVVLVPVGLDGADVGLGLVSEGAVGVALEVQLVLLAAGEEVQRLRGGVAAGGFDVAFVDLAQVGGAVAADAVGQNAVRVVAQEMVGVADQRGQVARFFRPFEVCKGYFRPALAHGVAPLFQRDPHRLQVALHVGVGVVGVKGFELPPQLFRRGVGIVGPAAELGQALGAALLLDLAVESAEVHEFVGRGGRPQEVARRVPGAVVVPAAADGGRLAAVAGLEAVHTRGARGVVAPQGQEQDRGRCGAGQAAPPPTAPHQLAQPSPRPRRLQGLRVAARKGLHAAAQERHVPRRRLPHLPQARLVLTLDGVRQPGERPGQAGGVELTALPRRSAETADGERRVQRAVRLQGVPRHVVALVDQGR